MRYLLLLITLFSFSQQTQKVDFTNVDANLSLNTKSKSVFGIVIFKFNVLSAIDSIRNVMLKEKILSNQLQRKSCISRRTGNIQ